MRPPRLIFTTRRLMIAVAVLGLLFGGVNLGLRSVHYRREALIHEFLEEILAVQQHHSGPDPERSAYHAALKLKYQRAAARPWLAVEPDPPDPIWHRKPDQ